MISSTRRIFFLWFLPAPSILRPALRHFFTTCYCHTRTVVPRVLKGIKVPDSFYQMPTCRNPLSLGRHHSGSPSACKQHAPSIRILSQCSLIPAIFLLSPHHAEIMMPFFSEPAYGPILKHESSSFCKKIVTLHRFFQHPAESYC